MSQSLFLIISAFGLLAALGTVLARNLVHAALYLVAFFFIIACQFLLLEADFLAAVQVLVYIGAVAILMMFGIMLTRNVQGDATTMISPAWYPPALVAGIGIFVVLAFGINNHVGLGGRADWAAMNRRPALANADGTPTPRAAVVNNMGKKVGDEMLTRFVVPFEVAGLLLTAALVGSIALAYRDKDDDETPRRGARATVATRAPGGSGNGQVDRGASLSEALSHSPQ